MKRVIAEKLCKCSFIEEDGTLYDSVSNPHVLMPAPEVREGSRPIRIVPAEGPGYFPTKMEMDSWEEVQKACDALNIQMGCSLDRVERIILASMGGRMS